MISHRSSNPYRKPSPRDLLGVCRGMDVQPVDAVRWLQYELQKRNIYLARIDGLYGRSTQKSIHTAQKLFHLRMDGIVTQELIDRLEG